MQSLENSKSPRKATNLSLDPDLLAEAKEMGINISRSAEEGISMAVLQVKKQLWLEQNRVALESSNSFVEQSGIPLASHRRF